ncbi:MAG: putative Ig domain-containing protein [Verrucomicrobiota bacterium]
MKNPFSALFPTAAFLWVATLSGMAQSSEAEVIDINTQPPAANTSRKTMVKVNTGSGEILMIGIDDPLSGSELWRSDGTALGTRQVRDILPGTAGSEPRNLTTVGNRVFFTAQEADNKTGLWVTNGEFAGTTRLKLFDSSGLPGIRRADRLNAFNGRLIFRGYDNTGSEIWMSDGTVEGTVRNLDITGSPLNSDVDHFFNFNNNTLYFTANNGSVGRELWKMNSTFQTSIYQDIQVGIESSFPADSSPIDENTPGFQAEITAIGGYFYFVGDGPEGIELRRTDGSGTELGTTVVSDIVPGSESSSPRALKAMTVGGTEYLYFAANQINVTGRELWRTEPQSNTTQIVRDIVDGVNSSGVNNLIVLGSSLFFTANDGQGVELWRSNGNVGAANTTRVTNINPGAGSSNPTNFTLFNNNLSFTAVNGDNAMGLHSATAPGVVTLVKQFAAGDTASNFVQIGSNLYFLVNGSQLWVTNGVNAAGTTLVKDFQLGNAGSFATGLTANGTGLVYFSATDGLSGQELWKSDGTQVGTSLVANIRPEAEIPNPPPLGSAPTSITPSGEQVFFSADATGSNRELWVTDGSGPGTRVVKTTGDLEINIGGASDPTFLTNIEGVLYFSAVSAANGREPWRSDGTPAGTVMIADLVDDTFSSNPEQFVKYKNDVFFVSRAQGQGTFLRKASDPLNPIKETTTTNPPQNVEELLVFGTGTNEKMFFVGVTNKGVELWKSNGINNVNGVGGSATECIDINLGTGNSNPEQLTVVGTSLFFVATDGNTSNTGRELWRTTGSLATTKIVKDIFVGTESSDPENLIESGGKLFFTANTAANGRELWVSNGTAAGTLLLKDIVTGPGSPEITNMRNVDGILVFSANNGTDGREVWISDGTALGTRMLQDLAPQSASSNPGEFTALDGRVLFTASTPEAGNELLRSFVGSNLEVELQPANSAVASGSTVTFPAVNFKLNTTLTFTLKNTGVNVLKDIKPVITGVNASEFTLVAPKAAALVGASASTTMAVRFTPKEGGIRRATLSISSNDNEPKPYVIQLEGTGNKDPEITLQPLPLMLNVGEPASFESTAIGTAPLALQWRRGSASVAGATSTTLNITAVTLKDAGAYTLFVKGSPLTAISNPAELGVVEDYVVPPTLVAGIGKVATLKVNAAGNQLIYQWMRQRLGEPTPTDLVNDDRFSGATTKTLVIKGLLTTDTAEYSCRVANPAGSKIGGTTQLNVFGEVPDVLTTQDMPNGVVGGNYLHTIKIDPSPLKAALTYSATGLPPGLKVNVKTGEISGRPTKEGNYTPTLTAKNTLGGDSYLVQPAINIETFPSGVEGIYAGTVAHDGEINGHLGGRLDLTITKTGAFSGSLFLGGSKLSIKGAVDVFRAETNTLPTFALLVKRTGKPVPEPVTLTVQLNPVTGLLTSESKVTTTGDTALITGWRRVDAVTAGQYIGYYTFGLELGDVGQVGEASAATIPQGWSYGSFTVAKDGKLTFAGRTADGDKITGASFVGVGGKVAVFQTMYTPLKGSLLGDLTIDPVDTGDLTDNTLTGDVEWVRPADPKSKTRTYVAGFGMTGTPVADPVPLEATGSIYVKPVGTALTLGLPAPTTLDLDFRYGGLLEADAIARLDASVIVAASHKITQPTPATTGQTKLASIAGATGLFTGSFALTDADLRPNFTKPLIRKVTFQGIMVKDHLGDEFGAGFFLLPERPEGTETPTTVPILGGEIELTPNLP